MLVSFYFPKEQTGIVELQEISFSTNGSVVKKVSVNQKEEFDNLRYGAICSRAGIRRYWSIRRKIISRPSVVISI